MNQQVGDGEDISQKSNYGRSIDEAKSLINQLEAFKTTAAAEKIDANTTTTTADESDPTSLEKNTKSDVK
jgi:hypothetical protein